jgi:hypothetical protein
MGDIGVLAASISSPAPCACGSSLRSLLLSFFLGN